MPGQPRLVNPHPLFVGAHPPFAVEAPEIEGFDPGGGVDHGPGGAGGGLGQQGDIADTLLPDRSPDFFGHPLHKAALQELFGLKFGERLLLGGVVGGGQVSFDGDEAVEFV